MLLPNSDLAEVADRKLVNYLLYHTHPQNKGKAAFYTLVGYTSQNASQLKAALLQLVHQSEVSQQIETPFGQRYVVDGWLACPNGKSYPLRTVWFISTDEVTPKLATAYPN